MATISKNTALREFTQRVLKPFVENREVASGFRSWFKDEVSAASQVTFEIKRKGRPMGVDIQRHEDGIVTSSVKSTQKAYIPPYFNYKVQMDAFDSFERVFGGSDNVEMADLNALINQVKDEVAENVKRIERAEELQRAQALLTGEVTLSAADSINFNRKPASLVGYGAAIDWNIATVNPGDILVQGARFMITEGDALNTMPFDVICGSEAIIAFQDNPLRQEGGDIKDQHYMDLAVGATNRAGLTPQGAISRGNHRFNLWGYEDYYDVSGGSSNIQYMDPKSIIIMPRNTDFVTFYGGTKTWRGSGENAIPTVTKGKRNFYQQNDWLSFSKMFGVQSAPVALLRSIDNVFTATVIAP
jgi:hypothetical protein